MADVLAKFKKKFALAVMFWATGSVIAFMVHSTLGEYTAFTAIVLGLFAGGDVADKKLNGGRYTGEANG